ncbi:MAG: four helix bundle protein [Nanoarchaeota archaeon]|nr:four helix bundle protein [Nanoarchaeota archaeon]
MDKKFIKSFEDLDVYKRLFDLAIKIHDLTLEFPKFELYEIGSQLRRSSNSAPANLAEGFNNKHTNIYLEGISRAQGEIRETKHHLRITFRKSYLNKEKLDYFVNEYDICGKMLTNLERSLESKKKK